MKKFFSYFVSALVVGLAFNSCADQNPPSGGDNDPVITNQYVAKAFSVAADKTIVFSQGNLQYNPAQNEWRFATLQYDTVGIANKNVASDYNGWIDLFGWGTGKNPTQTSKSDADYSEFEDWGQNPISNGGNQPNQWRTLTTDEWRYVINLRDHHESLMGFGSVAGINGLILLPDDWTLPSGLTFYSWQDKGFVYDGRNYSAGASSPEPNGFTHNVYTAAQWMDMEKSGAVFLPAAGSRSGTAVSSVNTAGYYFHANKYASNESCATQLQIHAGSMTPDMGRYLRNHCSVRLVQ